MKKSHLLLFFALVTLFIGNYYSSNYKVQAATKTVEWGASWSYGRQWGHSVYSNLASSSRWHSSSVVANSKSNYSGNTKPGVTSKARVNWAGNVANSYYRIW